MVREILETLASGLKWSGVALAAGRLRLAWRCLTTHLAVALAIPKERRARRDLAEIERRYQRAAARVNAERDRRIAQAEAEHAERLRRLGNG